MRPVELMLMLHYFYCIDDHPLIAAGAAAWIDWARGLQRADLLQRRSFTEEPRWEITERGRFFVKEGLCRVPVPEQTWRFPSA